MSSSIPFHVEPHLVLLTELLQPAQLVRVPSPWSPWGEQGKGSDTGPACTEALLNEPPALINITDHCPGPKQVTVTSLIHT